MENRSVTMYRLAKDLGVHQTTIKNWLEGKGEPRISEIQAIADTLGVDPYILMTWESNPTEMYEKWLTVADPIFKYLYSIGYVFESSEPEEATKLGALSVKQSKGFVLKSETGDVFFTEKEFDNFKVELKKSADYLIWQQSQQQKK